MSPGGHEHKTKPMKGIPLTVKITISVALLVALFMAGFGVLLHGSLEDTIREQIQHEAINAARTAAQADLVSWEWNFDTVDQGLSMEEIQARVDAQSIEDFEAYNEDTERRAQVDWNSRRFRRFLGDDTRILAVEIFRWQDGMRLSALGAAYPEVQDGGRSGEFTASKNRAPTHMGLGESQEGLLDVGDARWHVIRGSYPILGPGGEQTGEVVVHVHAKAIDAAAMAFSERVSYAGVGFLLVSVLLAYIIARALTDPVRRLQVDAQAVVEGDLHHHTRPHSTDEIGQLARTFEHMTRWLAEATEAEEEVEAFRHELAVAADVTASLFPKTLPVLDGWTLGGLHDRESSPGGGTYDVLKMPGGKLGVVVAEASSGGAPGALVAAMARSTLRFAAERNADPGAVLREANARLAPDLSQGLNVAVLLVVLDPATGKVSVANAGHTPLLHYHAGKDALESVHTAGHALGAARRKHFEAELAVAELTVEPGDKLVMFASAISELPGPDDEALNERRLAGLVKQAGKFPADQLVEKVATTLRKYHGGPSLGADVTLVAIGRHAE